VYPTAPCRSTPGPSSWFSEHLNTYYVRHLSEDVGDHPAWPGPAATLLVVERSAPRTTPPSTWPVTLPGCRIRENRAAKSLPGCFGRSDRSAQRSGPCHSLMETNEGPRKPPSNCRQPPFVRGAGRRDCCRNFGEAGPEDEGAILLVWLVTWASGRCRPVLSWIDRAGRVLGAAWVAITLLSRSCKVSVRDPRGTRRAVAVPEAKPVLSAAPVRASKSRKARS
jgi:hypothetical protein